VFLQHRHGRYTCFKWTLHYGAQLLRRPLSSITVTEIIRNRWLNTTVIEIIRNRWLNTQRPDIMETYCHQGRFKTRRTGNPHISGCILDIHNFPLYLALHVQCQFRTTCRNSRRMYICIGPTNVSYRPYLPCTTFSATSRHVTHQVLSIPGMSNPRPTRSCAVA